MVAPLPTTGTPAGTTGVERPLSADPPSKAFLVNFFLGLPSLSRRFFLVFLGGGISHSQPGMNEST